MFNERYKYSELTEKIIGCAIEVHRVLGPGLLESSYETCMEFELRNRELLVKRQVPVPIVYKEIQLECGYRIDLLVNDLVVIEIKSVETILRVHEAQILSYLKFANKDVGLLINFNVELLKYGLKKFIQ